MRTQRQMHQELEREPTLDELAREVADGTRPGARDPAHLAQTRCRSTRRSARRTTPTSPTSSRTPPSTRPADAATKTMLHEAVEQALGELTEREQEIVRMRFGLDDGQAKTLEEVGKRVRRHPRADPPDRGQDAGQAAPPACAASGSRSSSRPSDVSRAAADGRDRCGASRSTPIPSRLAIPG